MHIFHSSKATFSVLIAAGAIAVGATQAAAVNGVISSTSAASVDYCHSKFPAIRQSTLGTSDPQLKRQTTGDVVDYYGPCNHNPRGKTEAAEQEHEYEMRLDRDYGG